MLGTVSAFAYRHRETKKETVSRWPVAGPSEYWLLASSSASKVKKKQQCTNSTTNTHKITTHSRETTKMHTVNWQLPHCHLHLGLPTGHFPSDLLTKALCTSLFSPVRVKRPSHLTLLHCITLITFGDWCKSRNASECNSVNPSVISHFWDPNILSRHTKLGKPLSYTINSVSEVRSWCKTFSTQTYTLYPTMCNRRSNLSINRKLGLDCFHPRCLHVTNLLNWTDFKQHTNKSCRSKTV